MRETPASRAVRELLERSTMQDRSSTSSAGPGTVLGAKYVLQELLGEGGMGAVYLAAHPALARKVAIKILPRTQPVGLCLEAVAASRVHHPGSIAIHDVGLAPDGSVYIVMEHVEGRPLSRIIAEQELPLPRALAIADQILAVVEAAHAAGVVHGDIKSDNFLVEERADGDRVVLIDYGLAQLDGERQPRDTVAGTPEYLAPELVEGAAMTTASDLYAVGMILYELVTGRTPFSGGTADDVMTRQLEDVVLPMSVCRSDLELPRALDHIVMRALSKDPAQRYPDAAAMRHALKSIAHVRVLPGYSRPERVTSAPADSPTRNCGIPRTDRLRRIPA